MHLKIVDQSVGTALIVRALGRRIGKGGGGQSFNLVDHRLSFVGHRIIGQGDELDRLGGDLLQKHLKGRKAMAPVGAEGGIGHKCRRKSAVIRRKLD